MKVKNKALVFFIVVLIVGVLPATTNNLSASVHVVEQLNFEYNLSKLYHNDRCLEFYQNDDIIRRYILQYITNEDIEISDRFNIATIYTEYVSKGREDLVLFLIAFELAKHLEASVIPIVDSYVVYKDQSWSILITHGSSNSDSELNEIVETLANTFKTVILGACFSQKFSKKYSNVIGFSGKISFGKVLSYISQFFQYKKIIEQLSCEQLRDFELTVVPQEFVNIPGIISELVMGKLLDIFLFNTGIFGSALRAPEIITLEAGDSTFGCKHINDKMGNRMSNGNIEEILISADALFFWATYNLFSTQSLIIVHLNPQQPDDNGIKYWISYAVIGIRPGYAWTDVYPTPFNLGWHPYFTVMTAGMAYKKTNPEYPTLAAVMLNLLTFLRFNYPDVEKFPEFVPQYQGYTDSVVTLSGSSIPNTGNGDYIDQKVQEFVSQILAALIFPWLIFLNDVLIPLMDWIKANPGWAIVIALAIIALIALCIFLPEIIPVVIVIGEKLAAYLAMSSVMSVVDDDGDGISNDIELMYFDLYIRGTEQEQEYLGEETTWLEGENDYDEDGLSTFVEVKCDLDPFLLDSDGNSINDNDENFTNNPYLCDEDGDTIPDYIEETYFDLRIRGTEQEQEYLGEETTWLDGEDDPDTDDIPTKYEIQFKSNPSSADTDGDGRSDTLELGYDSQNEEIHYTSCPYLFDSDFDGIGDSEEYNYNLDPLKSDSDDDGLIDGWEIYGYLHGWRGNKIETYSYVDPLDAPKDPDTGEYIDWIALDSDNDGLNNTYESMCFTSPYLADTDGDGLNDFDEVMEYGTDPTTSDTDKDGLDDEEEVNYFLTDPTKMDTDGDWMPDNWEIDNFLNPFDMNDSNLDPDNDDLMNFDEYTNSTDPKNDDTDDDGLEDGSEIITYETDPLNPDTDGDLLLDGAEIYHETNPLSFDTDSDSLGDYYEIMIYYTNPNEPDTDEDSLNDGLEVYFEGTNPLDADTDNDGLNDGEELNIYNTDPLNSDSDGDGMSDGWEVNNNFNPLSHDSSYDSDSDGATNLIEYLYETDPHDVDTDNDGIPDGWEISKNLNPLTNDASADYDSDSLTNFVEYTHNTNPFSSDTDGDTMPDAWEILYTLNPINANDKTADKDNDGLRNFEEFNEGTNPDDTDTDGDSISDYLEVCCGTNPLVDDDHLDYDGDGLTNYEEIMGVYGHYTDPTIFDTDGDGYGDGYEIDPSFPYTPSDPTDPNSIPTVGGGGPGGGIF